MTSIIKVDNLQNQCGANIISESANIITIGASGDTVTLAAGASQSGFGRSGSVNWDTTPKTSSPVTAVSGNGYFINTTSIAITVNLPSTPAAGDIVAIADYANTSATNNITVGRNGSNIDGETKDGIINVNGQVYTLVYVDSTEGWKTVNQTFNQITLPQFVAATGGTVTCCGNYKIHTFTGPGTFTVTNAGNSAGSTTVDYLVVAGGGAGGTGRFNISNDGAGGGGGAGGYRESVPSPAAWTASPLANPGGALPVSVQGYPITIGGGGVTPSTSQPGDNGSNSSFSTITSAGGGGGGAGGLGPESQPGKPGGSGGGGGGRGSKPGGTGNTPPTSPSQGNNGGISQPDSGGAGTGGGGGATSAGAAFLPGCRGGPGGDGAGTAINPSPSVGTAGPSAPLRYFAGGGGGAGIPGADGTGGFGGGTNGVSPGTATSASANTGGGGGGYGPAASTGGSGGSGIVVIRYKFQ
jgi:hypothetical protein